MKKILSIVFCCLFALGLYGCNKDGLKLKGKSNIELSLTEVSMTIKEGTLSKTGATVILNNNSDKEYLYGTSYEIEVMKNGEWYKIDAVLYFTSIAYSLDPHESVELTLSWQEGYGKLDSGTYRIIKNVDALKEDGSYDNYDIAVEFSI